MNIFFIFILLILIIFNINKFNLYENFNANIYCPKNQKSCKIQSKLSGTKCALSMCKKKCDGNPNIC